MNWRFSDERVLLQRSLAKLLADRGDADSFNGAAGDSSLWKGFSKDLGILDTAGWTGGDHLAMAMVVMEELGAALATEPFLETAVIGQTLLDHADKARADAIRADIARGEAVVAFGWAEPQGRWNPSDVTTSARADGDCWRLSGRKSSVSAAPRASILIVTARSAGDRTDRDGLSLFLVDRNAPGVSVREFPTHDGRWSGEVFLDDVRLGADALIGAEGEAADLVQQALDHGTVAVCSEAIGIMRTMLRMTAEYLGVRRQFGVPIGTFQALRHRVAEMRLALEQSISMIEMAIENLNATASERMMAVAAAKVLVARSCRFVAQNAVQLHGGNGITAEGALGRFFKRATIIEREFGTPAHHLDRYCELTMQFTDR